MKTSELIGAALDWAVAKADGVFDFGVYASCRVIDGKLYLLNSAGDVFNSSYSPSTNWSQGGLIIEREDISFRKYHNPTKEAHGTYYAKVCRESGTIIRWSKNDSQGPTPLIAAMRCFVASRLGDEVELPEELR